MSTFQHVGDSPFLKRILVPFWAVRMLVMVAQIALYGVTIGTFKAARGTWHEIFFYGYYGDLDLNQLIGVVVALIIAIIACLALDLTCIIKRTDRSLTPGFFLTASIVQTAIWTLSFIFSMTGDHETSSVVTSVII